MSSNTYIKVNDGIRIHYRLKRRNAPCLVFLSGAAGSISAFLRQENFFSRRNFSQLFIDYRGHGKSDKGKGKNFFRIEKIVDDIAQVMEHLNITKAVLIGHCFGSFVAQEFAEQHPERLSGLILINSSTGMKRSFPMHLFLELLFNSIRYLSVKGKRKHPDYRKHFGSIDLSPGRIYTDIIHAGTETYSRVLLESLNYIPPPKRSFSGPTLILHGQYDSIINPRQASILGKLYSNSEVVYLRTNHCAVINDPKNVNLAILSFIYRVKKSSIRISHTKGVKNISKG